MPIVSRAQQRVMYAAKAGNSTIGIPQAVGADFVSAGPKGGSFAKLPKKKKPPAVMQSAYDEGSISDKAMKNAGY